MKSVADHLASETLQDVSGLSVSERVALALRLGEQAVEIFAAANHVAKEEARDILRRNSRVGRRPSSCASDDPE